MAAENDREGIGLLDGQGHSLRGVEARVELGRKFGLDVPDQEGATLLGSDFGLD
ncbi:hypothetical protein [Shewanella colwelliana]|uniref:hypothetical protein n=1 Tax=Shewanella colwelliana TaxID=23 RepID=UPI0004B81225|nr:hypothetical protein [Shewanella colwelliana]